MSVRIPPDSEKSNLIRIEGDPQGVQQAKRELLELASRMVSPVVVLQEHYWHVPENGIAKYLIGLLPFHGGSGDLQWRTQSWSNPGFHDASEPTPGIVRDFSGFSKADR